MPLRALPMLGPSAEKKLLGIGISTLGQLQTIAEPTLVALFGNHGASVGLRSRGIDPSRVGGDSEAKSISREGTFAADVIDSAHLHAVLRGFCESVGTQLRRSGRRARTVSLKLRYEDFTTVNRSLTPGQPISSDEAIYEAADTLLTRLRTAVKRPVRLIGVGLSNFVEDVVQLTLEPSQSTKDESLSATFDTIRKKYGSKSLQTGRTAFDKSLQNHGHPIDDETSGFARRGMEHLTRAGQPEHSSASRSTPQVFALAQERRVCRCDPSPTCTAPNEVHRRCPRRGEAISRATRRADQSRSGSRRCDSVRGALRLPRLASRALVGLRRYVLLVGDGSQRQTRR